MGGAASPSVLHEPGQDNSLVRGRQSRADSTMDMDELVLAQYIEAVRAESRHASWDYHSRASVAHRYVAMTVPKVACTTIKMALQTWEGCGPEPDRWGDVHAGWAGPTLLAYPTAQIVEMLRSPDYLRFSFVRNPYSRLVSAWKSKLAWDDPQYGQLRASIREVCDYPFADGQRAGPIAFRDAVECLLDNPHTLFDLFKADTKTIVVIPLGAGRNSKLHPIVK